jgi:hypothetical protein
MEKRFQLYKQLAINSPLSPTVYNAHISKIKLTMKPCAALMKRDSIFSHNVIKNNNFVMVGNSLISYDKPYNDKFSKV